MKKTDYKSMVEYSSPEVFFKDEFKEKTETFLREVIELIPRGENWQKKYIFDPDIELYNKDPSTKKALIYYEEIKIILGLPKNFNLKYLQKREIYPFYDIKDMDWSFCVNLLDKRFFESKNDELSNFLQNSRKLRNTASHSYKPTEAWDSLNGCINFCDSAKEILIKEHKTDSQKTTELFDDYKEYLEKTKNDFSIVKKNYIITEANGYDIRPEFLYNYNIFADEKAFMTEYDESYIDDLTTNYSFPVIVCKQTIDYLEDCIKYNTENRDKAKVILKKVLTKNKKLNKRFKHIDITYSTAIDSAEEIVWYIKDALSDEKLKDKLFCVITEKKSLAKELWALNNNDRLIVIHAKNNGNAEFFCYPGNESTEALEKPADNPKMELVFENAETVSSSFGNSSAEEIESVDNLNLLENRNSKNKINHSETVSINTSENKSTTNSIESKNELLPEVGVGDTIILDRGHFENIKNKEYELEMELYAGGEGAIYKIKGIGTYVVKMYHKPPSEEQCNKLLAMVDTYAADSKNKFYKDTCCWPKGIVYDLNRNYILGYAMEYKKNAVTLDRFLNKIQNDDSVDGYTRKDLVELCVKICNGFTALNKICNGEVLMGDINLKNIMVTEDKNDIIFIDADSYQFKDYLCPVGTSDFTSPRLIKIFKTKGKNYSNTPRNKYDENFAIAVLIFSILFIKEFPFSSKDNRASVDECIVKGFYSYAIKKDDSKNSRRNYIYKNLTKEIKEVFNEIFKEQKHSFGATNWIEPLQNLKSAIISGKSSDEIFPTCYLSEKEDDCFEEEICGGCNKKFLTAKSTKENTQNDSSTEKKIKVLCPDCLTKKALAQTQIVRVSCSCCGASFTTNEWDYDLLKEMSSNKNEFECPDCNPAVFYSKKRDFIVRGNNLEETQNFEKKLIENMSYAFKHLQEKMP